MERSGYVIRICDEYYIKALSKRFAEASITDRIDTALVCNKEEALSLCDKFSNNDPKMVRILRGRINDIRW